MNQRSSLPYTDSKSQGAADFYFAINATFRFIRERLGEDALRKYWRDLGEGYFRPVTHLWSQGGFSAIGRYWRDFFEAESGSEIQITEHADQVILEVKTCPAIAHLRKAGREIDPLFCHHCYYVSDAMAGPVGCTVRVKGGNGNCIQRFSSVETAAPLKLEEISFCL